MPQLTEELRKTQEQLYWDPEFQLKKDLHEIYDLGHVEVGWPEGAKRMFDAYARAHSAGFVGLMFGDEGKGRIVDDKLKQLLSVDGVKMAYVVRWNGGSNAGHSLESEQGRFAVHQVPSGILYPEAIGVMDKGMVINPENLKIEIEDIEEKVGDLRGKLVLSEEAILNTDLERAEEVVNRMLSGGKSDGGTSMGISPSYSHSYDRTGLNTKDLFEESQTGEMSWRDKLGERYDRYEKIFKALGYDLKDIEVPDLRATRTNKKATPRKVGTKDEFLDRLEMVRTWFADRDQYMADRKMITNTYLLHHEIFNDLSKGLILEGAQGIGLHPWIGNRPDVTSSDTTLYGPISGTGVYRPQDIADRMGVFKLTYTSKVPQQDMPTAIHLPPKDLLPKVLPNSKENKIIWKQFIEDNRKYFTRDQIHALWIIMAAGEFGTTTGRLRGIQHLDMEVMKYHARMGGLEVLGATHMDIAKIDEETGEPEPILVCTHYTKNGKVVSYQPGLEHQKGVEPHFELLPGWDGQKVASASSVEDVARDAPNALKFLSFIQRRTGLPIVVATTGPKRGQLIPFAGYDYMG